jgi:ankyrin repeat protein
MKIPITKMTRITLLTTALLVLIGCEKPSEVAESSPEPKQQTQTESQSAPFTSKSFSSTTEPIPVDVSNISLDSTRPLADKSSVSKDQKSSVTSGVKPYLDSNFLEVQNADLLTRQPSSQPALVAQVVTLTPETLDLGSFSTSEKGTGSVTLTNTGDAPVTIERAKASCGCTALDFRNNTVLQPGDSTTVNITMDGKGRARKMSKTVTFSIANHPPLRLPVIAETIAFVTIDKDPLTIENDDGFLTITLTSIDDKPFKITSILPAIAVEFPSEASAVQELKLDWNEFWDVVATTKVTIRLDHPLCREITTNIRLTAEQRQRLNKIIQERRAGGDLPTKANSPLTGDQLSRYIKVGRGNQVLEYITDGLGKFDAVDRGGVTLLSTAAEAGDAETVVGLLEFGALVERVDRVNRTPIMYAARSKNPETIQILLDAGADIQARDRLGNTPLSWAAGFGIADGVQVLVDAGADANTVDSVLGYTPLIWAAGFGESASIQILIEAGADVSVNDFAEGRTPLMHAVRTGSVAGVAALLKAGAKVNAIDNTKSTALHVGADSNNVMLDKIVLLVEAGSNTNAKNSDGRTALDLAKSRTDDDGSAIAEYLATKTETE